MIKLLPIILLAASLHAQQAAVIPLSINDTSQLRDAYDAMKAAEAKWEALKQDIDKRYLVNKSSKSDICITLYEESACQWRLPAFTYGFDISEGFRYIVPKAAPPAITNPCWPSVLVGNGGAQ
jgi:hypothetical protein